MGLGARIGGVGLGLGFGLSRVLKGMASVHRSDECS